MSVITKSLIRRGKSLLLARRSLSTTTPEEESVIVEKDDQYHIMSIGLNRPDKRNCVNSVTAERLSAAFHDFESDESMFCAILYGRGGNFSAGYDLEELSSLEDGDSLADKLANFAISRSPMGPTRMDISKPVIAAVDGYAVAGGMELALMCDLRVIEESSKLGFLSRRFGVPLIDGGTVRLPELIGLSRAMDLILTGRLVTAKEAMEFGIANRLVQDGTAYGRSFALAQELIKYPQQCLRVDRQSAYYATFSSKGIQDSLQFESDNGVQVIQKESIEGAKKFVSGLGKHGKFNVNKVVEQEEWQKELKKMKEEQQSLEEK